jgi:alpha-mannosidase
LTTEAVWEHGMKLQTEYRIYDELRRLDIVNTLTKQPMDDAEAVYHSFPLAAERPTVYLDTPGAVMRPGVDQVPATATDWHSIQHYFAVAGDDFTAVVASPDVPLVQVNGINTGRWQETLPPPNGLVMSWVMNNYWFTNFPARQGGRITYRYSVMDWPGQLDAERARRFAREIRQSLLCAVR